MLKYVRPYTGTLAHKFHLYIFLGPSKRKKNISLEVFVSLPKQRYRSDFIITEISFTSQNKNGLTNIRRNALKQQLYNKEKSKKKGGLSSFVLFP